MLLGFFSAWAQSQLKESTAGCLGGKRDRRSLSEVTCENKPQQGLLPCLLGSCFKLRLLHVALPELHCRCITAMPVPNTWPPTGDRWTCLPSLTSALTHPHGGAWCPGFGAAPLASSLGVVGPAPAGEGPALPTLRISLAPDPRPLGSSPSPWGSPTVIQLSLNQSICYQKENPSIWFLDSFTYEFHRNCRTTLIFYKAFTVKPIWCRNRR